MQDLSISLHGYKRSYSSFSPAFVRKRPGMNTKLLLRALSVVLAAVLLVASAGVTWAVADDYQNRDVVPVGVKVEGEDVGGMTEAALREHIAKEVVGPLSSPLTLKAGSASYELPAGDFIEIDVEGMVAKAMAPRLDASLQTRVIRRVRNLPVDADVEALLKVREEALVPRLGSITAEVREPAVDSTLTLEGTTVRISASKPGVAVSDRVVRRRVSAALLSGQKTVEVPLQTVKPKVDERSFGKTIVVKIGSRRLWLYDGAKLEKTYQVAVGTASHPTPKGTWKIVNKRYRPTWRNPGSAWAKDMPASIPPGRNNPLGTRALDLNASGIRIHGSNADSSIGTAASHGCMRMHMWDIEDLYPRVPVGTRVFIIR